jgi:glycosyltransferase involved in cell wall biosynthesis
MAHNSKTVLHIINAFMAGGSETLICRLAPMLLLYGYRSVVVSLGGVIDDVGKSLTADLQHAGMDVIILNKPAMSERWKTVKRCVSLIRQYQPDIVHTHGSTPDLYGGMASWIAGGVQHISTVHSTRFDSRLSVQIVRPILNFLTKPHYIAISDSVATAIEKHLGISQNRIYRVPNGVDTSRFSGYYNRDVVRWKVFKASSNDKVIVSIGRLEQAKNYPCLLKAFAILIEQCPNLKLFIFGEGGERQHLESGIDNLGLSDLIRLPGVTDDVPTILRSADLFVLPSAWEGFGLAAIEAMMAGIPVIISDVGGLGELAEKGAPVLTFPSKNEQALAEKIRQVLKSPELTTKLGQSARNWAMQKYSLDTMVNGYISLYDRLLNP